MSHLPKQQVTFYEGTRSSLQIQLDTAIDENENYNLKQIALSAIGGGQTLCVCVWNKEDED